MAYGGGKPGLKDELQAIGGLVDTIRSRPWLWRNNPQARHKHGLPVDPESLMVNTTAQRLPERPMPDSLRPQVPEVQAMDLGPEAVPQAPPMEWVSPSEASGPTPGTGAQGGAGAGLGPNPTDWGRQFVRQTDNSPNVYDWDYMERYMESIGMDVPDGTPPDASAFAGQPSRGAPPPQLNQQGEPPMTAPSSAGMTGGAFEGLPPELIQQIVGMSTLEDELGVLQEQLAEAQALRNAPMPEGRQAGRVFVAANPLEFAGRAYGQFRGKKMEGGLREQQQGVFDRQKEGRQRLADALLNAGSTTKFE